MLRQLTLEVLVEELNSINCREMDETGEHHLKRS
jgi:hypothetical protein